jgi:LysM repeat protein
MTNFEQGFVDQMRKIAGGYSPLGALALGGLGAAAGALADRKKRRRGALIGGILGALGGTAIDLHDYSANSPEQNTPGSSSTSGDTPDTPSADNHAETSKPVAPKPENRTVKDETASGSRPSKDKPDTRPSERKTYAQIQYEKEREDREQERKDNPTRKVQVEGTGTGGYPKRYVYLPRSEEEEYENGKLPDPAPAKVITEGEDLVPYKVRPGETLSSLSALGLDWMDDLTYDPSPNKSKPDRNAGRKWLAQDKWIKAVMQANPYLDPDKIMAGQTIYIPKELYGGIRSRDWYDMSSDDRLDWWDRVVRETAVDDEPLAVQSAVTSDSEPIINKDGSKSYVVQPGDDIYSIALKLDVPPLTLRKTHTDGKFRVGETVVVP